MAKHKSHSARWLREHFRDPYVTKAKAQGYRSRAVFKLQGIDTRERLLRPSMVVVDLGAAPGGWSQWAVERVGAQGQVIALDILPMVPPAGVQFIQGDFCEDNVLAELQNTLAGRVVDLVMSDMAPNMSGMAAIDQPRAIYLGELALAFAQEHLGPEGSFLLKTFQGEGFEAFYEAIRQSFSGVRINKPSASRGRSREVYIVARRPRRNNGAG
ncbi:23S rRNA (uridine(2552)-2'-O)-methyltransferase RlmE [Nitrosococcus wardiae]|uniref:Ribosomal RNA large subunit methyltransferase E n=1 Tax=Nitrosococcus wardiae TaxID=1814290 RepID=A0A4P7BWV9_9GAMM|nr:23S rRNA (uridine(2552)-2'-O)-methyltransferase RlmE [Nitrosococcus wardiae]QBQ53580.1 23S rRNA (uridine(2552)-2'-O)-methyltransferase RlmE [Nitrosococcus wardiae]